MNEQLILTLRYAALFHCINCTGEYTYKPGRIKIYDHGNRDPRHYERLGNNKSILRTTNLGTQPRPHPARQAIKQ